MKVLMLVQSVDSFRPGPDGFITDWVREIAKNVTQLTVLTYHYSQKEKLPKNTKIVIITGSNFLTRNINLFINLLRQDTDVLFAHTLEVFSILAGLASRLTGRKSFFWYCQGYNVSRPFPKLAFFLAHKILTCTKETKNRYIKEIGPWTKDKIITVGHGINIIHYQKGKNITWPRSKDEPIKLLYAGRISPIKDFPTLENAVKILKKRRINVSLEKATSYTYNDNYKIFKLANIFVTPSLSKALDKTYLESFICNVPAIGTNIAYPFMKDKFPQFIYNAGDANDLAKKIIWLIDHPEKIRTITAAAKKFVTQNYSLNKLMNKIVYAFTAR